MFRFSLYIFGSSGEDAEVLRLAYAFEQRPKDELKMYTVPKTEISDVLGGDAHP
jgi:hypothetical protein